ncbi:ECF transporter S component [Salininema proteolyticum]|uniref:ECF transporter S component n=1 Tax=Salininema proteolyticum TaxID=1607685 RepID=A0ABV8U5J0_9ACTN
MSLQNTPTRWRMADIIACAVLAVAFGAVFQAWNLVWAASEPLTTAYPPASGLLYGVWLMPAVLAPLLVRKTGAAVFTEGFAALVSTMLGSAWGLLVVVQGFVQGLGGEAAFAAGRYKRYNIAVSVFAGALSGLFATTWDVFVSYGATSLWAFKIPYILLAALSGAVVAGLGSWALYKALLPTGAVNALAGGADRKRV